MKKGVASWCVVVMVVVLVAAIQETAAVDCSPYELSPCLGALTGGTDPTAECCSKLKEQVPCFCGYLSNPLFRPYIESPNAQKVATSCGISIPTCT